VTSVAALAAAYQKGLAMWPRLTLCFAFIFLCAAESQAQLFWRARSPQVSSSCPGGVCPTNAAPQATYRPIATAAVQPFKTVANRGHWSYPGDITSHLEGTHGVATAGMTREQKLSYHDSLHEGTASRYRSVSGTTGYGSAGAVSYGSAGGFAVGSRDSDGAVITSLGSTGGVSVVTSTTTTSTEVTALAMRSDFRKALMDAAKASREKGEITVAEYFKIAALSRIPKVLANLEASVHEAAIEEGIATVQAPDWNAIIDFIERLIPLIIKLIDLFSFDVNGLNTMQYANVSPRLDHSDSRLLCDWTGLAS